MRYRRVAEGERFGRFVRGMLRQVGVNRLFRRRLKVDVYGDGGSIPAGMIEVDENGAATCLPTCFEWTSTRIGQPKLFLFVVLLNSLIFSLS